MIQGIYLTIVKNSTLRVYFKISGNGAINILKSARIYFAFEINITMSGSFQNPGPAASAKCSILAPY